MRQRTRLAGAVVATGLLAVLVWATRPLVLPLDPAAGSPLPVGLRLGTEDQIRAFLDDGARGIDALVVVDGGAIRMDWGETDRPMHLASVRKSVISLLYGIAIERGLIDLDATLGRIGIDESRTPLTETEGSATVRDLLASRSGVYLPSGAESAQAAADRPARGSVAPGSEFWYNNWDFNVLGTIFERQTGMALGQALDSWLAAPIGLQDFAPHHVVWALDSDSDFPTWRIWMSARDLARIGVLVAQEGAWNGRQVVSADWIAEILHPVSRATDADDAPLRFRDYGLLWWIDTPTGEVAAAGSGGQFMIVDPSSDLVLVARRENGATPLGYLLRHWFGSPGRFEDLLTIRALARDGR